MKRLVIGAAVAGGAALAFRRLALQGHKMQAHCRDMMRDCRDMIAARQPQ